MQPSEIEGLPFYEVEYTIENLTNDIKNKNDQEEEQSKAYDPKSMTSQYSKMAKNSTGSKINIPKMPKMPSSPRIPSGGFKF